MSELHARPYHSVFNVGADKAYTLNHIAGVAKQAWGTPEAEVTHEEVNLGTENSEGKFTKLRCFFPHHLEHAVSLEEGMARTVKWVKTTGLTFAPVEFNSVEVLKNMPASWITPALMEVPAVEHTGGLNGRVSAMEQPERHDERLTGREKTAR